MFELEPQKVERGRRRGRRAARQQLLEDAARLVSLALHHEGLGEEQRQRLRVRAAHPQLLQARNRLEGLAARDQHARQPELRGEQRRIQAGGEPERLVGHVEVAEALGIKTGTAHSRHHHAMQALRAAIEADARPPASLPEETAP